VTGVQTCALPISRDLFPGWYVKVLGTWELAGQRMAKVAFRPVQYLPAENRVYLATSLTFRLAWMKDSTLGEPAAPNLTPQGAAYYEERLSANALNEVRLPPYLGGGGCALPSGQYEEVIVTPQSFGSAWDSLVEWRTQTGMPCTVVTKEYIYSAYSGSTNMQKIRNFVQDAYTTWGARYFLLGADGGTATLQIPYHQRSILGDDIPNDTYYADLNGDWVIDVHVGRASVTNTTQIGQFIDKILFYEKTPPATGYAENVFFMGFDLDSSTDGEDTKILNETLSNLKGRARPWRS